MRNLCLDSDIPAQLSQSDSIERPNLIIKSKTLAKTTLPSFWNYSKSFRNSETRSLQKTNVFEQICDLVAPELISGLIYGNQILWWDQL